ncbi:YrhB domain-containing protein [Neptuniibacter sp. PT8_73]|uniref:YrhB domain-containing protein n=1 Tax=Neptuniibacter sp. PT8_73 TaxID=3398206 RepID=UPI0039F554D0
MNKQEAQSLVEETLAVSKGEGNLISCMIIPEETIEKPWGWVFYYQSKEYVETRDFRHMLAGNAPIIVNRITGELWHTGTAFDIEHYIKEYEAKL